MTTTVTKDQLETLSTADNGQAVSETKKYTGEFEGKFIGTLVGNATTAKQLEQPYNFSLAGDAEGTVAVNASSVVLNTTVNHATEADTADFAGKTNLAARATLADMANTAEFAYRAGRLSNLLIKLHGGVTGSGQLTNADTMDIAISGVDVSYFFVFSALPEKNPDITKAYVDLSGHHFWIYDTANTVWKDAYEYLTKTLELHGQRLDVLEKSKTTNTADIETLKSTVSQQGAKLTNHEDRITVNEKGITAHDARITTNATDISALDKRLTAAEKLNTSQSESLTDHEKRIGNIETTTDVGQISTRVQAIEDKNVEQDTALDNETKARIAKEELLDAKDTELTNALADEQQAREQKDTSLETKNTEQDNRLDAIETKNTEQDKSIKANTTNINANTNSISGLNSQVTAIKENYVTTDTVQTITETKTFSKVINGTTPIASAVSNEIITAAWARTLLPAGSIIPFAGSSIPTGYLLCNGAAVSRTTYADLFKAISTLYGAGDGSTTFNLPDLRDRFLEGAGTNAVGTKLEAGLPNITGSAQSYSGLDLNQYVTWKHTGAIVAITGQITKNISWQSVDAFSGTTSWQIKASSSNNIYANSTTVQPKAITVQYLIRY